MKFYTCLLLYNFFLPKKRLLAVQYCPELEEELKQFTLAPVKENIRPAQ
jgi:hypothetical protein